jgi:GT2 family glycosyltransferase
LAGWREQCKCAPAIVFHHASIITLGTPKANCFVVPSVSVIVPTHQRRDALHRLLDSLTRQTVNPAEYEVIVSVDGSTDGTHEMIASLAPPYTLRTVAGPQRGRAAACNAGLNLARGEVVIILDDDMQVVPEFIERHRRHHSPGSRLCVLGAVPVDVAADSSRAALYVQARFAAHLEKLANPRHVYGPRDFYSGNASMRAEVLHSVGCFDESFRAYGNEDVELWVRLKADGVHITYDPEALARQEYCKDLRGLARDTLAKGTTAVLLARMHPDIFGALRLAMPTNSSRPWLAARSILLRLTGRIRSTAAAVFIVASALERIGLWRQPLFYRALLDYAFWAGVVSALNDAPTTADLAELHSRLHRGALDLLLHG